MCLHTRVYRDMAERAVSDENEVLSDVSEDEISLTLSCGSSSFDDDIEINHRNAIAPFQFEPYASGSDVESDGETDSNDSSTRLQNTDW